MFVHNKYRKWYLKLINHNRAKNRTKKDGVYYEKHHILPRSLFPQYVDAKWNIVLLTGKEHFIAHRLLAKCTSGQAKYKMVYALGYMLRSNTNKYVKTSRTFNYVRNIVSSQLIPLEVRQKQSRSRMGKVLSIETRKKMSDTRRGRKHSAEHAANIGLAHKGKVISESHRKSISAGNKGKKLTPEQCLEISKRFKGKPRSESFKRAISERQINRPGVRVTDGTTVYDSYAIAGRACGVTKETIMYRVKSNSNTQAHWQIKEVT